MSCVYLLLYIIVNAVQEKKPEDKKRMRRFFKAENEGG
jgi:hypothetical protein